MRLCLRVRREEGAEDGGGPGVRERRVEDGDVRRAGDGDEAPAASGDSSLIPGLRIDVVEAPGVKCPRCWKHSAAADPETGLCPRCASVVAKL